MKSTGKRKRGRPPKLQKSPEVGQQKVRKKLAKSPEVGQQKVSKKLAKSPDVTERNGGVTAEDMVSGEVVFPVVVGLEATKVNGSASTKEKLGVDKKIINGLVDKKSKSSSKVEVYTAKKDKPQSKKGMQVTGGKHKNDSAKRARRVIQNIDAGSPNQGTQIPCCTTDMDHKLHPSYLTTAYLFSFCKLKS